MRSAKQRSDSGVTRCSTAIPVYVDPEAAQESVFGGLVAPPTMLQAWTLKGIEMARP